MFFFYSLFIFHKHSTREPASSWLTYFILRAYTRTTVSQSQHRKKIGLVSPKSTKRLRDGSFLVECPRRAQAENLFKTVTFVDRPVHVFVHKTLNSSRGVIRCRELSDLSEVEIRDELKTQGVVEVHRVT